MVFLFLPIVTAITLTDEVRDYEGLFVGDSLDQTQGSDLLGSASELEIPGHEHRPKLRARTQLAQQRTAKRIRNRRRMRQRKK